MPKIYQRKDDRYTTAITSNGHRYQVYGKSMQEVKTKLARLIDGDQRQILVPPSHQTIAEYLLWWLSQKQLEVSSITEYRDIVEDHLIPGLGSLSLERLTPIQILTFYNQKRRAGISETRLQKIHDTLSTAYNFAIKVELVGSNPLKKVDRPQREDRPVMVWDDEEARRFVKAQLESSYAWAGLWVVLMTGTMRLGEALGLQWDSVSFEEGSIVLRRALTQVKQEMVLKKPKTKSSVRVIKMPALGMQILTLLSEKKESPFVFLTNKGTHPQRRNLERDFHKACERAGVSQMKIKDLRHLSASLLIQEGIDVKLVQQRLGHSTPRMTLNIYSHVLRKTDQIAADTLNNILTESHRDHPNE